MYIPVYTTIHDNVAETIADALATHAAVRAVRFLLLSGYLVSAESLTGYHRPSFQR
jgi:hypothetical protein